MSLKSHLFISITLIYGLSNYILGQNNREPLDPANAISNLELYPGIHATLFASEPMISSVTNLDIDHRGRVWVCEVMNYREHGKNNTRPEGDRILILEDEDGDGVADKSKTYYQGRDVDAAMGICVIGNQVIVSCAPNIILFTDQDGDDVPDKKEYIHIYTGQKQNDHSTHSFMPGPDGKLYWNMGNSGKYVHDRNGKLMKDKAGDLVFDRKHAHELPDYGPDDTPYIGGMIFRTNLDGSDFEVIAHNFRNNYENTIDSYGAIWQSDNDDDGYFGVRLNYILEYGNYGYRDEKTLANWKADRVSAHSVTSKRHWHQNDPGVVPNFAQTGAGSPTAITVYEGDLLPEIFHNQVIHCDAGPGVVWAAIAEEDGAGFKGHMINLLKEANRGWVKPVDVCTAPDGSLFVTDWYDPAVGWNRQWDVARGRIYRLAPENHKYRVEPADVSTPDKAASALKSPNSDVRYLARKTLLQFDPKESIKALTNIYSDKNPRIQARALWLLAELGSGETPILKKALKDSNPNIRVTAIRAARQQAPNLVEILATLVDDPSPRVRSEAAIALHNLTNHQIPDIWAQLAHNLDVNDRWNLEALGIAADGRWDHCLQAWFNTGGDWKSSLGRKLIWRSRASFTPELLADCLNMDSLSKNETRKLLRNFDFQSHSPNKEEALRQLAYNAWQKGSEIGWLISSEAFIRLQNSTFSDTSQFLQKLDVFLKNAPINKSYLKLVARFGITSHFPAILDVATGDAEQAMKLEAIRALLNAQQQPLILKAVIEASPEVRHELVNLLHDTHDELSFPVLKQVLLNRDYPLELRKKATYGLGRPKAGAPVLIQMAEEGIFPEELKEAAGKILVQNVHVRSYQAAPNYFPIPKMKGENEIPGMTELVVMQGNVEAGKKVFNDSTCATCHQVNGEGINFGPNLSKIGTKLAKIGLYEAILNPSASVSESYQTTTVKLKDGTETMGLLNNETQTEISLQLAGGVKRNYRMSNVASVEKSNLSFMPENLQRLMTVNDLANLVEYMSSLQ